MFAAQGRVGHKVDQKGFQIAQGNHSLRRFSTLFLAFVQANLLLDNLSPLSFGNHPDKVGPSLHQRRSHLIGIHFRNSRHLLFRHVNPPLAAITTFQFASHSLLAIADSFHVCPRQRVGNPRHVIRVLAHFPSRRMEKVSMHSPLGHLGIFFTHIGYSHKRGNQKRTRGRIGHRHRDSIRISFRFQWFLVSRRPRGRRQIGTRLQKAIHRSHRDKRGPPHRHIDIVIITAHQIGVGRLDSRIACLDFAIFQKGRRHNQVLHTLLHKSTL
mmetsp:Transcript_22590/g.52131  ORF Transcript_22590/g.52131 Transcript_22590/m.52131 type:complete len:269 (-) Transcript_22590:679-1485(-)